MKLTIIYLLFTPTPLELVGKVISGIMTYPVALNYGANVLFLIGIFKYKIWPKDGGLTAWQELKRWKNK